jgi:pyrrolidone-carboxylate peptidase
VDGFEAAVNGVTNDTGSVAALQGHIDNFGTLILNRARAALRENTYVNPDDRPLYWSRSRMMVILKSHEFLLQNVADAELLVKRLDDRTRGFTPAPNFAAAGARRKVLVIGFDPFFLKPGQPNHNSHQSNPSGVAALFLHNATEIAGMFIQSVIVPVRFEDFDSGRIDNLVDSHLQGAGSVDMILSVSQDIDLRFHVDRFGTRYRTPAVPDNLGVSGKAPVHYEFSATQPSLIRLASNANLPRFLETTLPASIIAPGNAVPVAATGTQIVKTVIFDQKFKPEGGAELGVDNISTFSPIAPAAGVEVEQGSGGNYLSNELFYRVCWRRTQRSSTINTGHLHVPKLQQNSPPHRDALFDPARFKYFIDTMIQILKDALPGI